MKVEISKKKLRNSQRRIQSERDREKARQARNNEPAVCEKCEALTPAKNGVLKAHRRDTGRWCLGGQPPTEAEKDQSAPGRSIRSVSGGLPTLGKK